MNYIRRKYGDLYDLLASLLPPETETGRPRTVNMMLVIQGILYVLVSSCHSSTQPTDLSSEI